MEKVDSQKSVDGNLKNKYFMKNSKLLNKTFFFLFTTSIVE